MFSECYVMYTVLSVLYEFSHLILTTLDGWYQCILIIHMKKQRLSNLP